MRKKYEVKNLGPFVRGSLDVRRMRPARALRTRHFESSVRGGLGNVPAEPEIRLGCGGIRVRESESVLEPS